MSKTGTSSGLVLSVAIATALFCATCAPATAGEINAYSVDENGNGYYTSSVVGGSAMTYSMVSDPGPGGLPRVLAYLMFAAVFGDVILEEDAVPSDVLRFGDYRNDQGNMQGALFFYSDKDGGIDAIADVGMPGAFNNNQVSFSEVDLGYVGLEGEFGYVYTPTAGQPGFLGGYTTTYTFVSDVPEPGSLLLVLPAAAMAILYRRGRQA